ncbi:hypothetical protein ES705_49623 [subsurface metagenome]
MKWKTKKAEKITLNEIDKMSCDTVDDKLQYVNALSRYVVQEKKSINRINTLALVFSIIALAIALSILTLNVLALDILK